MTTLTTGIFFVRQKPAQATTSADGFSLVLHLVDNQGHVIPGDPRSPRRMESYQVKWNGEAARAWWAAHGPLKAGTPLRMELINPRSFLGELGQPETRARVQRCELAPLRTCGAGPAPATPHTAATPAGAAA